MKPYPIKYKLYDSNFFDEVKEFWGKRLLFTYPFYF